MTNVLQHENHNGRRKTIQRYRIKLFTKCRSGVCLVGRTHNILCTSIR